MGMARPMASSDSNARSLYRPSRIPANCVKLGRHALKLGRRLPAKNAVVFTNPVGRAQDKFLESGFIPANR